MFDKLDNSPLKNIVFPPRIALGKAALPKRFAEWLASELTSRYGLAVEIEEN